MVPALCKRTSGGVWMQGQRRRRERRASDWYGLHAHVQREKIAVPEDEKTKMTTAKVAPSKGVDAYAVDSVMLEQLGRRWTTLKSHNEPAMLALKDAVRRESELEIALEEVPPTSTRPTD